MSPVCLGKTRGVNPLAELKWDVAIERPSLRRAIRHRIRELKRPCRFAAENFLAANSRMDWLAVGLEGELVSLRIGIADNDAELLTRALGDLDWLRDRGEDLAKLVPDLGIEPSAESRAVLLCPRFQDDTRAAVRALPPGCIELVSYRCYRLRGQLEVVLDETGDNRPATIGTEPPTSESHRDPAPSSLRSPTMAPQESGRASKSTRAVLAKPNGFRTGLADADLRPYEGDLIDLD